MEKAEYKDEGRTLVKVPKDTELFIIPATVETIEDSAFSDCVYLKEIVIPATVKEMHMNPFCGCGARIRSESKEFVVIGDGLYSKSKHRLIHCFTLNDTFHVAEGTREIGACAFRCFEGDWLTMTDARGEIILPASVSKVERWAFDECCLQRLVINGKIDDIYATGPVDNCGFREISVPKGLGDYYRKRWHYHAECIKERPAKSIY